MVSDKLIRFIANKNVVTTDEVTGEVIRITGREQENEYVYRKFVYPLLKKKYVKRIRQNLYHVTTPGKQNSVADRFLVASKIRSDYYIGFHAALAFYGSAYSYRSHVHIAVKPENRFDGFQYQNTVYTPYLTGDVETGIISQAYLGERVKVCSKERLFVECIDRPELVGGWEEVLKSLESLSGLDFMLLADYLDKLGNQTLLRRVGFVLETLREQSLFYEHLDVETLDRVHNRVEGSMRYLVKGKSGDRNERWLLYVPSDFRDYLRGV